MIYFDITIEIFIILFLGGFAAGFVDSIAGGGGLISLPVLLSVGLPPQTALGTNKLQGTFGTLSASYNYIRSGKVDLNESVAGIVFTFIGAAAGAWLIQSLDPGLLKHIIPVLLMAVFVYTVISKDLGVKRRDAL
ncbi:MAG: TSUP family transporter, partial [Desulfobacteraceae bacterium]